MPFCTRWRRTSQGLLGSWVTKLPAQGLSRPLTPGATASTKCCGTMHQVGWAGSGVNGKHHMHGPRNSVSHEQRGSLLTMTNRWPSLLAESPLLYADDCSTSCNPSELIRFSVGLRLSMVHLALFLYAHCMQACGGMVSSPPQTTPAAPAAATAAVTAGLCTQSPRTRVYLLRTSSRCGLGWLMVMLCKEGVWWKP